MKNILLDTSAYSRYCRGDIHVEEVILQAASVFLSSISLGELYSGFKEGDKELTNLAVLNSFVKDPRVRVLNITEKTAIYYGQIKHILRKKGTPIPDNDIWIAAASLEAKSTLVTFDKHFTKVTNLKLWEG